MILPKKIIKEVDKDSTFSVVKEVIPQADDLVEIESAYFWRIKLQ